MNERKYQKNKIPSFPVASIKFHLKVDGQFFDDQQRNCLTWWVENTKLWKSEMKISAKEVYQNPEIVQIIRC